MPWHSVEPRRSCRHSEAAQLRHADQRQPLACSCSRSQQHASISSRQGPIFAAAAYSSYELGRSTDYLAQTFAIPETRGDRLDRLLLANSPTVFWIVSTISIPTGPHVPMEALWTAVGGPRLDPITPKTTSFSTPIKALVDRCLAKTTCQRSLRTRELGSADAIADRRACRCVRSPHRLAMRG